MYDLLRPLLFKLDAERAHHLTLRSLDIIHRLGLTKWIAKPPEGLPRQVFNISFPNPVGLAAGLDKNADHLEALGALGFGFIEVGTITPRPQSGNDQPRLFRLPANEALINRMGFNNKGVDAVVRNLERSNYRGVLGINIGKNKDTPNEKAAVDYLYSLERVYAHASYITINISSPNTQGLRDLQQEAFLYRLLHELRESQARLDASHRKYKPILLKIAPDLSDVDMDTIAEALLKVGIDGVICTNTTIARHGLLSESKTDEQGGLSGKPLCQQATAVMHGMQQRLAGKIKLIGVGGILSGQDAVQKITAGASLVQLYSGLIYRGPTLIAEAVEAIRQLENAHHDTCTIL